MELKHKPGPGMRRFDRELRMAMGHRPWWWWLNPWLYAMQRDRTYRAAMGLIGEHAEQIIGTRAALSDAWEMGREYGEETAKAQQRRHGQQPGLWCATPPRGWILDNTGEAPTPRPVAGRLPVSKDGGVIGTDAPVYFRHANGLTYSAKSDEWIRIEHDVKVPAEHLFIDRAAAVAFNAEAEAAERGGP